MAHQTHPFDAEPPAAIEAAALLPFERLFSSLQFPAWEPAGATVDEKVAAMTVIADRMAASDVKLDNPHVPAGYTYLGQFIAHDLTFDAISSVTSRSEPSARENYRSASLDLDCLYGSGPEDHPYLYSAKDPSRFVLGANENGEADLPRSRDAGLDTGLTRSMLFRRRVALVGDPRNDENIITSQFHLQMLRFHNWWIDGGRSFEEARRQTRWHYQWVVVHDFLKRLCGEAVVDDVLGASGTPNLTIFRNPAAQRIPIEFSAAAFRTGHSMVRPAYQLSDGLSQQVSFLVPFSDQIDKSRSLEGGRELPPNWTIQWDRFFEVPGSRPPQYSQLIDTNLSPALSQLPLDGEAARFRKLALRTLVRSWSLALPAGQGVAKGLGFEVVDEGASDPLWVYLLKEAAALGKGFCLGPLGARIVAEVLIGLLSADRDSYYACKPDWSPAGGATFDAAELLRVAGAPMTREGWYRRRADDEVERLRIADLDARRRRNDDPWVVQVPPWQGTLPEDCPPQ